jgi:hypothetical protein
MEERQKPGRKDSGAKSPPLTDEEINQLRSSP